MDIWPIDFNKSVEEIARWHDAWRVEKFGSNSSERYYNTSDNGRYLYGVAEGESLNDEKANCEKVLELLLRIKGINDKLSGKVLSQHLQWREREQLKKERETLYKEYLDIVKAASEQTKPQGRPTKPFKESMLNDTNGEKLKIVHTYMDGKKGKDAVAIILACMDIGWMQRPTYGQAANEFGDIGSKANYNQYLDKRKFNYQEEIEPIKNALKNALEKE